MKARIFIKFIAGLAALITIALVMTSLLTSRVIDSKYMASRWRELDEKARMLEASGAASNPASLPAMARAADVRITLIARDGSVIADTAGDASRMENHAGRPEVIEALAGRKGTSIRRSNSLGSEYIYFAEPVPRGVLRLSVPLAEVREEQQAIRRRTLESAALAFIPVVLIALYLAHNTADRLGSIIAYAGELANGNFHARLRDLRSGELAILGRKLNDTSAKLERTVQQLQTEHTELEKLERIRKDFVINVSHELRTPLASIQGYTETLLDGAIHDEKNNIRFLNIIRHNAERLARLTADLLALSRIEMKTQQFRFGHYRVNELLADVIDTIRPIAAKKRIELRQELATAGAEVYCDSEAIYQILSNLVDNAVKYTPELGTITIGVKPYEPGNAVRMLELFVQDTGIGIPVEDQSRLFERFYRVDKARSRELGGTGLGLAIVKHLVRTHGGEVWVNSEINKGATFFFTLPMDEFEPQSQSELHPEFTAS
jgi:two-component system phosphate regulon sensor histidine kinase PhoR